MTSITTADNRDIGEGAIVANRWEIVSPLRTATASSYARLWKAKDLTDQSAPDREFVLKAFRPNSVRQEEVSAVEDLLHSRRIENLAPILDAGEYAGSAYFVSPLYEAGNLDEYMRTQGETSLMDCLSLVHQVCKGLFEVMSELQRGHNDVKPQNIAIEIRDRKVVPMVLDWGVSQRHQGGRTSRLVGGTPFFSAPETWHRGSTPYLRDVYSLGALFYWLITCRPPFLDMAAADNRDTNEYLDVTGYLETVVQDPTPVESLTNAPLPSEVSKLVNRWVKVDPSKRVVKRRQRLLRESEWPQAIYWARIELEELGAKSALEEWRKIKVGQSHTRSSAPATA